MRLLRTTHVITAETCDLAYSLSSLELRIYILGSKGSVVVKCTLSLRAPVAQSALDTILKQAIQDKILLPNNELSVRKGKPPLLHIIYIYDCMKHLVYLKSYQCVFIVIHMCVVVGTVVILCDIPLNTI